MNHKDFDSHPPSPIGLSAPKKQERKKTLILRREQTGIGTSASIV